MRKTSGVAECHAEHNENHQIDLHHLFVGVVMAVGVDMAGIAKKVVIRSEIDLRSL